MADVDSVTCANLQEVARVAGVSVGTVGRVLYGLTPCACRTPPDGVADAVINQDAGHEVRSACLLAPARLWEERVLPEQERIRIDIFLKDNMP